MRMVGAGEVRHSVSSQYWPKVGSPNPNPWSAKGGRGEGRMFLVEWSWAWKTIALADRKAPGKREPDKTQESQALTPGLQPPFSESLASPSHSSQFPPWESSLGGALCPLAQTPHSKLCFSPSSWGTAGPWEGGERRRGSVGLGSVRSVSRGCAGRVPGGQLGRIRGQGWGQMDVTINRISLSLAPPPVNRCWADSAGQP